MVKGVYVILDNGHKFTFGSIKCESLYLEHKGLKKKEKNSNKYKGTKEKARQRTK